MRKKNIKKKLKKSWRSKTIWFNAVIIPILATSQTITADLQPYLSKDWVLYVVALSVIGNILLKAKSLSDVVDKQ